MARNTLSAARTELAGLLAAVSGVTKTYDHEPTNLTKPVSITVSTAGMGPTEYRLNVRVYVSADSDVDAAQESLDAVILATDLAMTATAGFTPGDWEADTFENGPNQSWFVATCTLEAVRGDYLA